MSKDSTRSVRAQSGLSTSNGSLREPIDTILDALRAAQLEPVKCRGGWKARCPAHDDSTPSLDMKVESDGKVLVICRSQGCSFSAIAAALGLQEADFFPHGIAPAKSKAKRRTDFVHPVAVYLYENPDGSPRFQVRRFNVFEDGQVVNKDFRQYRPVGSDWVAGLGNVEPILYRLPELLAADAKRSVVVLEGEKDVQQRARLRASGNLQPDGRRQVARSLLGVAPRPALPDHPGQRPGDQRVSGRREGPLPCPASGPIASRQGRLGQDRQPGQAHARPSREGRRE